MVSDIKMKSLRIQYYLHCSKVFCCLALQIQIAWLPLESALLPLIKHFCTEYHSKEASI